MFAADFENPWIIAAQRAPRRPNAVLVCLAGVVVAGGLLLARRAATPVAGEILPNLLVFAGLAAAAVVATRLEGRRLWPEETFGVATVVGGLALGLGAVFACTAVAFIMGAVGMIIAPPAFPTAALAGGMLLAAVGAVTQEMFFRGWIQPVVAAAWGVWPGLFLTAVAFAAFHVAAGAHGTLVIVNLLLTGLLLGLLALRSGGLTVPSAVHLIWAWTGFAGLATSPAQLTIQVRLRGPVLWSGHDSGLGGSLAVTAILLVLLLAVVTVRSETDAAPRAPEPHS